MKYIITTVQLGARLHANFYDNLLLFKKKHDVDKILVFVLNGRYVSDDALHPSVAKLTDIELITNDYRLGKKVIAHDSKVLPQNIMPMRGLTDKLPMQYSYVLPGTKRRYDSIASIGSLPRFFTTTGAMSHPFYKTHTNLGRKAENSHEYGFTFFEDLGGSKMNIVPIAADKRGNFYYLNERYENGKFRSGKFIEALILGDWHFGVTNKHIRKKSIDMIEALKPKYVIFHDFFDGSSINHHNRNNLLDRIRSSDRNKDSFEKELKALHKEMSFFADKFPNVQFLVPESNHDVFIRTYVDHKFHHNEPNNYLQAIKIIPNLIDLRKVALEEALKTVGEMPTNFKFFRENDSFRVRGVELAQHGHKGSNGSRGSKHTFKRLNLRQITGHTHSPCIYVNGMIVGTSTNLEQDYTIGGASSWMHAHGVLYPNGTYTLLTMTARQPKVK